VLKLSIELGNIHCDLGFCFITYGVSTAFYPGYIGEMISVILEPKNLSLQEIDNWNRYVPKQVVLIFNYSWSRKVTVPIFFDDISTETASFGFNQIIVFFISRIQDI
jgi:hypothetical protein